jgi:hypothetical protein
MVTNDWQEIVSRLSGGWSVSITPKGLARAIARPSAAARKKKSTIVRYLQYRNLDLFYRCSMRADDVHD